MKTLLLGCLICSLACFNRTDMKLIDNTPVAHFDLKQYLGNWYEIARFPHSFEKDLVGVTANYSIRNDGKIRVINAGYKGSLDGTYKTIEGKAKPADTTDSGHLRVSFFLFFYADYYILELDTVNYEYALVGSSSPDYLWILSRRPHIAQETFNFLVEKARERGYDTQKLIKVEQKPLRKYEEGKTI